MNDPIVNSSFSHHWHAEILAARPLILPQRHFVYPVDAEEVERGALELLIRPSGDTLPFLATCALGFNDPAVPTGVWSAPNPNEVCAVAGGYAYLISTLAPTSFTMIPYRPVLTIVPVPSEEILLFVGHHRILAWGLSGKAWESPKLSDEGISMRGISGASLHGTGWNLMSDRETPFVVDLANGRVSS